MDIRTLRYFIAVAREENFSRAARLLHITQPTLSRQISDLEDELGVLLFQRDTRNLRMTEDGLLLKRRAEEILSLVDKTEADFASRNETLVGQISIGAGELASMRELGEIIRRFHALYPVVTFDIFTANSDTVKDMIDSGLLDLGLFLEPVDKTRYEFARMQTRERWVALMRPDDPLAQKDAVTAEDLLTTRLILPRRMNLQSDLANWFGSLWKEIHLHDSGNLSSNSSVLVAAGIGCALCVEGLLTNWKDDTVTYRPLTPELTGTSVIAWKRDQPSGPAVSKFIDFIKEIRREMD